MDEISPQALREVVEAFERYRQAVQVATMTMGAKDSYLEYASAFVRWLQGDFDLGDATGIS